MRISDWSSDVCSSDLLHEAVPLCRDHRHAAALFHILANEISIIAFVGEQHFGRWPVGIHDGPIALEVGDLAAGEGDRYGQAHRTDAEMDLGSRSEEHTSELQTLMRKSYADF